MKGVIIFYDVIVPIPQELSNFKNGMMSKNFTKK